MAKEIRPKQVKVEWERIHETVSNCIHEYAISLLRSRSERQPHPGRWEVGMSRPITVDEQLLYIKSRRDVVDADGVTVARFGCKAASEFMSVVSPDVVLVLLKAIEGLSTIVARHRNEADGSGVHTESSVRRQVLKIYSDSVPIHIADRANAIRDEQAALLPPGCKTFDDTAKIRVGRGRVANYTKGGAKKKGKKG